MLVLVLVFPQCGVSPVWCDTAVVGGAQGSSGEQRLWCEPVAAGRTPRRESNTETGRGVISSYSGAPDILVHLVYWCIKPKDIILKPDPAVGEQQKDRQEVSSSDLDQMHQNTIL